MILMFSGDNEELKKSSEEAARLRRENAILNRHIQELADSSSQTSSSKQTGGASLKLAPKLDSSGGTKPKSGSQSGRERSGSSYGGSVLTVSSSSDGFETVNMSPDERGKGGGKEEQEEGGKGDQEEGGKGERRS